ncbi:hypothetical protein Adt_09847 [Abeliophyllum distichum]|uniref:Uncharacterized protein n=1 Tax=Abeliophyllum distichum TaxID=126358 RepID=A0ABD1UJY1_9LAMI
MGTTTKWGRAKLNSSTIEHDAAAAGAQNVPRIPFANLTSQPPIPFENRSRRRSTTLDFEWTQTTLRKTREEAVRKTREEGVRGQRKRMDEQFTAGEKKEKGAVHSRRKKKEIDAGMHSRLEAGCLRWEVRRRLILEKTTTAGYWRWGEIRAVQIGRNETNGVTAGGKTKCQSNFFFLEVFS